LAILSSSSTVARGSLEGLSREVAREGVRGVVFLDHAPFHRSRGFREAVERWRARGLEVAYLPRYSPHLNPVESYLAAGEGVFDAPAALRKRKGAEGGGGGCHGEAQGRAGAGGVAKSMHWHLAERARGEFLLSRPLRGKPRPGFSSFPGLALEVQPVDHLSGQLPKPPVIWVPGARQERAKV
jgi:hypothetical protein